MYEVNKEEYPFDIFIYKTKNEFNQIIQTKIITWNKRCESIHWNVSFIIGKRKNKNRNHNSKY